MKLFATALFLLFVGSSIAQEKNKFKTNKLSVLTSVENHQQELIKLSDQVWTFAETALAEKQSSKVLADYAEAQGFNVKRGVAEMPSAFIAEFGSGKPII